MCRPYSKRSFLRQYLDWLVVCGVDPVCDFRPIATRSKKFDPLTQRYTNEIDYELADHCSEFRCRFLREETLKPLRYDQVACSTIDRLCGNGASFGLCQTGYEAKILRNYLLISGGDHFPMLIPQPSILSGQKRPDFLCLFPSRSSNINLWLCWLIGLESCKKKWTMKKPCTRHKISGQPESSPASCFPRR
jgi:hypothetical protein